MVICHAKFEILCRECILVQILYEPVNVGRGSDVLKFDPNFLKISHDPTPGTYLKCFLVLSFHLEGFFGQISSSS